MTTTAQKIGEGQFAEVFKGLLGRKEVAVKVLSPAKAGRRASVLLADAAYEAGIVAGVKHPALVELLGVQGTAIISELVPGTPMSAVLYPKGGAVAVTSFEPAEPLVAQLAAGIACLHEHGVVHRDLKPENVMVWRGSAGWQGKIIDFGLAVKLSTPTRRTALDGSPLYASPECFALQDVVAADDVWALACVSVEVFGSGRPWPQARSLEQLASLVGSATAPFARLPRMAEPLAECLGRCFASVQRRPDAAAIVAAAG